MTTKRTTKGADHDGPHNTCRSLFVADRVPPMADKSTTQVSHRACVSGLHRTHRPGSPLPGPLRSRGRQVHRQASPLYGCRQAPEAARRVSEGEASGEVGSKSKVSTGAWLQSPCRIHTREANVWRDYIYPLWRSLEDPGHCWIPS